MVAGLTGASITKGLLAGAIGLVVTIMGNDPVLGAPRLTLGMGFLDGGIPFLPVLIGVFAFAQIMSDVEKMGGTRSDATSGFSAPKLVVSHLKVIWEILSARPRASSRRKRRTTPTSGVRW